MSKDKDNLEKIGITKDSLNDRLGYNSELNKAIGLSIKSYDITDITTDENLRSKIYRININLTDGKSHSDIIKGTWPGLSISGHLWRGIPNKSASLERNEIDFLKFSTENKAYTPKYRWDLTIQDGDIERTYYQMSDHNTSSNLVISEKPEVTFDLMRRTLDKILAIGYISAHGNAENQVGYRTETPEKLPAVWSLDESFIKPTVYETLEALLRYTFKSYEDREYIGWLSKFGFKNIAESLSDHLIKLLAKKPAEFLFPLTLHPGNILVGNELIPSEYNPDVIYELAKGYGDVSGDGIVITDFRRIGKGNETVLEQLLRHPLVLNNLSEDQLNHLSEHIFIQYRKLRAIGNPQRWIPKKIPKTYYNTDKAAIRLAVLNKLNYYLGRVKLKEKSEDFLKIAAATKDSVKRLLSEFTSIKNDYIAEKSPEINQSFRELIPNGIK